MKCKDCEFFKKNTAKDLGNYGSGYCGIDHDNMMDDKDECGIPTQRLERIKAGTITGKHDTFMIPIIEEASEAMEEPLTVEQIRQLRIVAEESQLKGVHIPRCPPITDAEYKAWKKELKDWK